MKKLSITIVLLLILGQLFSLSFDEVMELSLKNYESIKIKQSEIRQSQFGMQEAQSKLWPEISAQGSATWLANPPEGITMEAGSFVNQPPFSIIPAEDVVLMEDAENTYFQMALNLKQTLFTWGKIQNSIAMAQKEIEISGLKLQQEEKNLRKNISDIYYGTLLAYQSLPVLQKSKDLMDIILADRKSSFDQGFINLQKVYEAESNKAMIETQFINLEESYKSGVAALLMYTGLETWDNQWTNNFRTQLPQLDNDVLIKSALEKSIDINILEKQKDQTTLYSNIEKGSQLFLPDIALSAKYEITGQKIPFSEDQWDDNWNHDFSITLGAQIKLFDGLSSYAKIGKSEESKTAISLGIVQAQKGLELQIIKAIHNVKLAYYQMKEKMVKAVEIKEQYKNAQVTYENELITREEVRSAQTLLYNSELEILAKQYEFETALQRLEQLSGMEL